jgi:hypothetical protein
MVQRHRWRRRKPWPRDDEEDPARYLRTRFLVGVMLDIAFWLYRVLRDGE